MGETLKKLSGHLKVLQNYLAKKFKCGGLSWEFYISYLGERLGVVLKMMTGVGSSFLSVVFGSWVCFSVLVFKYGYKYKG